MHGRYFLHLHGGKLQHQSEAVGYTFRPRVAPFSDFGFTVSLPASTFGIVTIVVAVIMHGRYFLHLHGGKLHHQSEATAYTFRPRVAPFSDFVLRPFVGGRT